MLIFVIIALAILSVALAYKSLRSMQKLEEVGEAKKELTKGKVIFQNDSS